eukprot:scaffold21_cov107-Cylindrotheca_fusiformis.AAC.4
MKHRYQSINPHTTLGTTCSTKKQARCVLVSKNPSSPRFLWEHDETSWTSERGCDRTGRWKDQNNQLVEKILCSEL